MKSHTLKFTDLVQFETAQIRYRARNNLLPRKLQTLFIDREGGYNLRGKGQNNSEKYVHNNLWGDFMEWFGAGVKTKHTYNSV